MAEAQQECSVMFGRPSFCGLESKGTVKIDVVRLGNRSKRCSVNVSTDRDANVKVDCAQANAKFEPIQGYKVVFEPGEWLQQVHVHLVNNNRWEATKYFMVKLDRPIGGQLGDVTTARVNIADDDIYPAGTSTAGWTMMKGFLKEQIKERKMKFWKTVFALTYKGLFTVIDSIILKLIIDDALMANSPACKTSQSEIGGSASGNTEECIRYPETAIILAGCYLVFFGFAHWADVAQQNYRGRSGTRKWLRNSMLVRYLTMGQKGKESLRDGDFYDCIFFQVELLVNDGWYSFLLMIMYGWQIAGNLVFNLFMLQRSGISIWPIMGAIGVVVPLVGVSLWCREAQAVSLLHERAQAEDRWIDFVHDTVSARSCILAYGMLDRISNQFKHIYEDFYNKHRKARFYQQTTKWIPAWVMAVMLAGLYSLAPVLVASFSMSAGEYASIIKSFLKLKQGVLSFYSALLKMQRSIVALEKVSHVLNRPTFHADVVSTANITQDADILSTLKCDEKDELCLSDLDTIRFQHVHFGYSVEQQQKSDTSQHVENKAVFSQRRHHKSFVARTASRAAKIMQGPKSTAWETEDKSMRNMCLGKVHVADVDFSIPATGRIIRVDGGKSLEKPFGKSGKRTLLRLMTQIIQPTHGQIWMPPHKRICLVQRDPIIMHSTVLHNLRFGIRPHQEHLISDENCWDLALQLGLDPAHRRANMTKDDIKLVEISKEKLKTTDVVAIAIARALLSTPGIVLLDHLGDALGQEYVEVVLGPILRKFALGGLSKVLEGKCDPILRHKPTVIWASLLTNVAVHSDLVVKIQDEGVQVVSAASARSHEHPGTARVPNQSDDHDLLDLAVECTENENATTILPGNPAP